MLWEIKKLENKEDFKELEIFYRKKFSNFFHYKLTAEYLFWKLKENFYFNGIMLVAKIDNRIIGSLSLTFKSAYFLIKK